MTWAPTLVLMLAVAASAVVSQASEREATATCRQGIRGSGEAPPLRPRDLEIGPLRFVSIRNTPRYGLNAFGGHGFKIPAGIPDNMTATLSIPRRLRNRVGFVYTLRTQGRVLRRGVRAADGG